MLPGACSRPPTWAAHTNLAQPPASKQRCLHLRLPCPHPSFLSPPLPQGADGTAYEGCTYRLSLRFTSEYPFKPPVVRFETPCFHPNVDTYGNICLDILKDKWSGTWGWLVGWLDSQAAALCL